MFKGLTKDLAGTADICSAVDAASSSSLIASSYLLPLETVLFAFQSAKEEFVFTNEALITVKGENATTTRKLVERHEYRDVLVSDVAFETTGRLDRDCEIKFTIGAAQISIDIARKEEDAVKIYYKALLALSREQQARRRQWQFAGEALTNATAALKLRGFAKASTASDQSPGLTQQADDVRAWMEAGYERLNARCYRQAILDALQQR